MDYLVRLQRALEQANPRYMRWVRPETLHLTLVFLGNQPPARLDSIVAALRSAADATVPFVLHPGEPGAFGSPRQPQVVWTGVHDPSGALQPLHRRLCGALNAAAIAFDERPLTPHITLGRAQSRSRSSRATWSPRAGSLADSVHPRPEPIHVSAMSLMQSELRREGPRYTELARANFGIDTIAGAR